MINEDELRDFDDVEYNLSYINISGRNGEFWLTFSKLAWDFKRIYWDPDTHKLFIEFKVYPRHELLGNVCQQKKFFFDEFN